MFKTSQRHTLTVLVIRALSLLSFRPRFFNGVFSITFIPSPRFNYAQTFKNSENVCVISCISYHSYSEFSYKRPESTEKRIVAFSFHLLVFTRIFFSHFPWIELNKVDTYPHPPSHVFTNASHGNVYSHFLAAFV